MSSQHLAQLGHSAGTGGAFLGGAGSLGLLASAAAFLSQQSNTLQPAHLLMYGLLLELARRGWDWLYARFTWDTKVTATFTQGDLVYEWVMHYLTEEGLWKRTKDFDVSLKSSQRKWAVSMFDEVGAKQSADYVPKWLKPVLFRWNGYWVDVSRLDGGTSVRGAPGGFGSMKLQFFTLDPLVIARFVEDTRERYEATNAPKVIVHMNNGGGWGGSKSKIRRPIDSVSLPYGVMDSILADVRDFMDTEDWYTQAGIPHHRGYLLYGPPGTGKSSTIYAIAGELGIEIYNLSLSSQIDDTMLHNLAASVPRGAILLIEDIDCAFPSRDADSDDDEDDLPVPTLPARPMGRSVQSARMAVRRQVTMSGLLNLMDGVGSDDHRILQTNYYERLDPALIRPGRIDMKIEYHHATSSQASDLFNRFFPASRFAPSTGDATRHETLGAAKRKVPQFKISPKQPLADLAAAFANGVPQGEFSAAELQGFLLRCKWDPERALSGLAEWVEEVRSDRLARTAHEENERRKRREKRAAKAGNLAPLTSFTAGS